VLEYCAGGSLDKLLFQTNVTLSDEHKIRLVRGISAGMLHLHKNNIVHRDLAARNILLTASGDPKISVPFEISVVSIFIPNTRLWHVSHFGKGRRRQDEQYHRSCVLDGTRIACIQKLQQEIGCVDIWYCRV